MADTKISALTAATDITSADIPIVQGGTNKRAANTLFADYVKTVIFSGLAKITVGTSAPGSPATGDLWIDTN